MTHFVSLNLIVAIFMTMQPGGSGSDLVQGGHSLFWSWSWCKVSCYLRTAMGAMCLGMWNPLKSSGRHSRLISGQTLLLRQVPVKYLVNSTLFRMVGRWGSSTWVDSPSLSCKALTSNLCCWAVTSSGSQLGLVPRQKCQVSPASKAQVEARWWTH